MYGRAAVAERWPCGQACGQGGWQQSGGGRPFCRRRSAIAALTCKSTNLTLSNMEWLIVCKFMTFVQIFEVAASPKKPKLYKTPAAADSHTFSHSIFDNRKFVLFSYCRAAVAEQKQKLRLPPLCSRGRRSATAALLSSSRHFATGAATLPPPLCHTRVQI
jgi:hypothetical protein